MNFLRLIAFIAVLQILTAQTVTVTNTVDSLRPLDLVTVQWTSSSVEKVDIILMDNTTRLDTLALGIDALKGIAEIVFSPKHGVIANPAIRVEDSDGSGANDALAFNYKEHKNFYEWNGSVDSDFNIPGNWRINASVSAVVPSKLDTIYVPEFTINPLNILSNDTVSALILDKNAILNLSNSILKVNDMMISYGTVNAAVGVGPSSIEINNYASGQFTGIDITLYLEGSVSLLGDVYVEGDFSLSNPNDIILLNGFECYVSNNFTLGSGNGAVQMQYSSDLLKVQGNANFDGNASNMTVTAGEIIISGNLTVGSGLGKLSTSGTAKIAFDDIGLSTINFADPVNNSIQYLELSKTSQTDTIKLLSDIDLAGGRFDIYGGSLSMNGHFVHTYELNVNGGAAKLLMHNPLDTILTFNAYFNTGSNVNTLTEGAIKISGNLTISESFGPDALYSEANHKVMFLGSSPQTITHNTVSSNSVFIKHAIFNCDSIDANFQGSISKLEQISGFLDFSTSLTFNSDTIILNDVHQFDGITFNNNNPVFPTNINANQIDIYGNYKWVITADATINSINFFGFDTLDLNGNNLTARNLDFGQNSFLIMNTGNPILETEMFTMHGNSDLTAGELIITNSMSIQSQAPFSFEPTNKVIIKGSSGSLVNVNMDRNLPVAGYNYVKNFYLDLDSAEMFLSPSSDTLYVGTFAKIGSSRSKITSGGDFLVYVLDSVHVNNIEFDATRLYLDGFNNNQLAKFDSIIFNNYFASTDVITITSDAGFNATMNNLTFIGVPSSGNYYINASSSTVPSTLNINKLYAENFNNRNNTFNVTINNTPLTQFYWSGYQGDDWNNFANWENFAKPFSSNDTVNIPSSALTVPRFLGLDTISALYVNDNMQVIVPNASLLRIKDEVNMSASANINGGGAVQVGFAGNSSKISGYFGLVYLFLEGQVALTGNLNSDSVLTHLSTPDAELDLSGFSLSARDINLSERFIMSNPSDYLSAYGQFTYIKNHVDAQLNDGVIEAHRNFFASGTGFKSNNTVRLIGNSNQSVYLDTASTSDSYFTNLEIQKAGGDIFLQNGFDVTGTFISYSNPIIFRSVNEQKRINFHGVVDADLVQFDSLTVHFDHANINRFDNIRFRKIHPDSNQIEITSSGMTASFRNLDLDTVNRISGNYFKVINDGVSSINLHVTPAFKADYQSRIFQSGDVNIVFSEPNLIIPFEPYFGEISSPRDFIKIAFNKSIAELPVSFRDSISKYTKIFDDEGTLYQIDNTMFDFMDNGNPVFDIRLRRSIEHSKLVYVNIDSALVDTGSISLGALSYAFNTNEREGYVGNYRLNDNFNSKLGINLSDIKSFETFSIGNQTFTMIFYFQANQLRLMLQILEDNDPRMMFDNVVLNSVSSSILIKEIKKIKILENGKKQILIDYRDAGRQAVHQIDFSFLKVDASFELGTGITNAESIFFDSDAFPEIYAVDTVNKSIINFTNYNSVTNVYSNSTILSSLPFDKSAFIDFAYINESDIKLAVLLDNISGTDSIKLYDLYDVNKVRNIDSHELDLSAINKLIDFKYRMTSPSAQFGEGPNSNFFFIGDNQTQFKKYEGSVFNDEGSINHNNLKKFDLYFISQENDLNGIMFEQDSIKFLIPDTTGDLKLLGFPYTGYTAYTSERNGRAILNLNNITGKYNVFSQEYFVGDRISIGPTQFYKTFEDATVDPNFIPGVEIYFAADPTKETTIIPIDSVVIPMSMYITASDSVILRPISDSNYVFIVRNSANFGEIRNIHIEDTIANDRNIGIYLDETNNDFGLNNVKASGLFIGVKNKNSRSEMNNYVSIDNQYGILGRTDPDRSASIEVNNSLFENTFISAIDADNIERVELDSVEFRHVNAFVSDRNKPLIFAHPGTTSGRDFRLKIENSWFHDLDKKIVLYKDTSATNKLEFDLNKNTIENSNTAGQSNELLELENSTIFLGNNIFRNNQEVILSFSTTKVNDTSYVLSNVFDSHQEASGIVMNIDIPSDSLVQIHNSIFLNSQSPRIVNLGTGRYVYAYMVLNSAFLSAEFAGWGIHHNPEPYFNIFENVAVSNFTSDYKLKANSIGIDQGLVHPQYLDPDGSRSNISLFSGSFFEFGLTEQTNITFSPSKDSLLLSSFVNPDNISNLSKYYIVSGDSISAYYTPSALTVVDSTNNLIYDLGTKTMSDAYYSVAASHNTDGVISRSNILFRQATAELVDDSTNLSVSANSIDSISIYVQNFSNFQRLLRFNVSGDQGGLINPTPRIIQPGIDSVKLYVNSALLLKNNNRLVVNMFELDQLLDQQVVNVDLDVNDLRFAKRIKYFGLLRGASGQFSALLRNPSLLTDKVNINAKSFAPLNDLTWINHPDSITLQGADSLAFTFNVNTSGINANLNTLIAKFYLESNGTVLDSLSIIVRIGNILQLGFTAETKSRVTGPLYQSGFIVNWLSTNTQVEYELELQKINNNSISVLRNDTVTGFSFAYNNIESGEYKLLINSIDTSFVSNTDSLRFSIFDKQINYKAGYWQLLSSNVDLSDKTTKEILQSYTGKVYRWNENLVDYVEVNDTSINNGKAYWFKPSSAGSVTYTESAISENSNPTIILKKGWNQVGNPWNWPIHWASQEVSFNNGGTFNKISSVDIEKFYGVHYLTTIDVPELKTILNNDSSFVFEPIHVNSLDALSYLANSRGVWVYSEQSAVLRFSNIQIPEIVTNTAISEISLSLQQNNSHSNYKISIDDNLERDKNVYRPPSLGKFNPMERQVNGKETFAVYTSMTNKSVKEYDFKVKGKPNAVSNFSFCMPEDENLYLWLYHIQSGKRERFERTASMELKNYTEKDHVKVYLTSDPSFEPKIIPTEHRLSQNFPNPFNPVTTIKFDLPFSEGKYKTKLVVFNLLGQKIKTLFSGFLTHGSHDFKWSGDNDFGGKVASGIYFYQLQAGRFQQAKKMILVK
jgi:hypothetical protein